MSKTYTFSSLICRDITGIPKEYLDRAGMPYEEYADLPVEVRYCIDQDTIIVEERCALEKDIQDEEGQTIFSKGRAFFLTDEEQSDITEEIDANLIGQMADWAYERSREE